MSQNPKVQVGAKKFNYEALDSKQRIEIQEATKVIREKLRRAARDIWEIGQMLSEVQSKLKRGQFDEWLKTEFDWSRRTAYKFISVYKRFDRSINLEEIDIATSALYLLAAESTPEKIREEFIQKAQEGKKITHQEVLQVVQESKTKLIPQSEKLEFSQISNKVKEEIEKPISNSDVPLKSHVNFNSINIERGWYQLNKQHTIFCGDTALPKFANSIPYGALAIAVTSDDWAHDWLIEKAKTVVVFPESEFERSKLTSLIVMFSSVNGIVIFPWLPEEEMILVTHQLGRKVYGGDIEPQKCQAAIIKTGLSVEKIGII